jgi:PIN domain nuclease of toxin-antitoxin system
MWWLTPGSPLSRAEREALDALPVTFHGDPADRLIVATARAHAMPLATHDAVIRKSRAAQVWKP